MELKLSAFLTQLYWLLGDLSEQDKQEVKEFLLDFVSNEPQARSRIDSFLNDEYGKTSCCPHCKSNQIVRYGKTRLERQRYRCKTCSRHFLSTTGTARYRSQTDIKTWLNFLRCFFRRDSIRKCAETCHIQLWRAFYMRHKVLACLEAADDKHHLSDVIQADEIYFPLSFKGCRDPEVKPPRRKGPKKRGLSGEQVCIPCALDPFRHVVARVAKLGKNSTAALLGAFAGKIVDGSTIVSDADPSYKKFCERSGFRHVELPRGKSQRGYDIQAINSYHAGLRQFINGRFHGVATKYLSHYIAWYNLIWLNMRKSVEEQRICLEEIFRNQTASEISYEKIHGRKRIPTLC